MNNEILITEIFPSLEGECLSVGEPTLFVRVWGCEIKCPNCDTLNSWKEKKYNVFTIEELTNYIIIMLQNNPGINRISFTGGNPMLYIKQIKEIVYNIKISFEDIKFNLEHPGYYSHSEDYYYNNNDLFDFTTITTDLKLFFAKTLEDKIHLIFSNIKKDININQILKFIVSSKEDLEAIKIVNRCLTKISDNKLGWEHSNIISIKVSERPFIVKKINYLDIKIYRELPKYISILREGDNIDRGLFDLVYNYIYKEITGVKFSYPMHIALNFR